MLWEDERYVRLYTRDTVDWVAWGWEAQAVFCLLMRKVDRSGILNIGKHGARGVAGLIGMPAEIVERALDVLADDGVLEFGQHALIIRNFETAQETPMSDKQRSREHRERARDLARAAESGFVTKREAPSRNVSPTSRGATPSHAVLSCAVPFLLPAVEEGEEVLPAPFTDLFGEEIKPTPLPTLLRRAEDLQEAWNNGRPPELPEWRGMSKPRRKLAMDRIHERPLTEWVEIIARIRASPWCLGQNDRAWKAGPKWLLQPDTADKVLEGTYDSKPTQKPAQRSAMYED